MTFMVLCKHAQSGEKFEVPDACIQQGSTLPSCFSSHTVNIVLFVVYVMPWFSHFGSFVGDFAVKLTSKQSAEVLFSVPKCQKAMMCLVEKILRQIKASFRLEL